MDEVVNVAHKKGSVNSGKLYPVANEDLVIGKRNAKIQGNTEEKGNYYSGNQSIVKSILVHCVSPEENYSLVLTVAQGSIMRDGVLPEM